MRLVSLFSLVLLVTGCRPSDDELVDQCPKRMGTLTMYQSIGVDRLKEYEKRDYQRNDEYVKRWCK